MAGNEDQTKNVTRAGMRNKSVIPPSEVRIWSARSQNLDSLGVDGFGTVK